MKVAALSLAGADFRSAQSYRHGLSQVIKKTAADVIVLPAYSSLALGLGTGAIEEACGFEKTVRKFLLSGGAYNKAYLELHSSVAREHNVYLSSGTLFEKSSGRAFHSSYCFDPGGTICGRQRQTHLTRSEKELGLSRGEELDIFDINGVKAGIIIGNDARHPETGRIFGLRNASMLLCSGAIQAGATCWQQAAGMWAQVQQNQFWAVEAQLSAKVAGKVFGAVCAIIGPCEITPGLSGYIARGYPHSEFVTADPDEKSRQQIQNDYPLLKLLNPAAYTEHYKE